MFFSFFFLLSTGKKNKYLKKSKFWMYFHVRMRNSKFSAYSKIQHKTKDISCKLQFFFSFSCITRAAPVRTYFFQTILCTFHNFLYKHVLHRHSHQWFGRVLRGLCFLLRSFRIQCGHSAALAQAVLVYIFKEIFPKAQLRVKCSLAYFVQSKWYSWSLWKEDLGKCFSLQLWSLDLDGCLKPEYLAL